MKVALVLGLMAVPAWAETPLSATEFESFSQGKTLSFMFEGTVFGREMYLPNQKVVWQEGWNGACHLGRWRTGATGEICFEYEGALGDRPHCLRFVEEAGSVWVYSVREPEKKPLKVVRKSRKPLSCGSLAAPQEGT